VQQVFISNSSLVIYEKIEQPNKKSLSEKVISVAITFAHWQFCWWNAL